MDQATGGPPAAPLTQEGLVEGAAELARRDSDLGAVVDRWGTPPLWGREPGFATLVHMILEQQVSLASARVAMDGLIAEIGPPEPRSLLSLDDEALLRVGFSRQKRRYARELARSVLDGRLDLGALPSLHDSDVRDRLTEVTGIGPWTADVYLLMALRRPDVWPSGDRALVVATRRLKGLDRDPDRIELEAAAERWRPLRSIAARILWLFYLREIRPPGRAK